MSYRIQLRRRFAAIAIALAAAAGATMLAPPASSADALPWAYYGGQPYVAAGSSFLLEVTNPTASTQTVGELGSSLPVGANDYHVFSTKCPGPPGPSCLEFADLSASSPDLILQAQGVLADSDGSADTETGFFLSPADFELVGPGGAEFDVLDALAASQASGLSSLQAGQGALQTLLSPIGGQLGGLQTSLTSLTGDVKGVGTAVTSLSAPPAGATSPPATTAPTGAASAGTGSSSTALTGEVDTLQSEVGALTREVTKLYRALVRSSKAKGAKRR